MQIIDGEIVLEEASPYAIEELKTTEELDKELLPEIQEYVDVLQATYLSFRNKPFPKNVKWDAALTNIFYMALRQCRTDFEMMLQFFKGIKNRM